MLHFKRDRKYGFIILATYFVVAFFLFSTVWNKLMASPQIKGKGIVVLLMLLAILLTVVLFVLHFNNTNQQQLEKMLNDEREKAKSDLLLQEQESEETDLEEEQKEDAIDQEAVIRRIIPTSKSIKKADTFGEQLLLNLGKELEIVMGIVYMPARKKNHFTAISRFAMDAEKEIADFETGQTLAGQAAKSQEITIINNVPEDYFETESGLGKSKPKYIFILPIIHRKKTIALLECATFLEINAQIENLLRQLSVKVAERFTTFLTKGKEKA